MPFRALFAYLFAFVKARPLLLTPLVEQGKLEEARNLSKVVIHGQELGHAGFFSVPSASGKNTNHMFFWYQPCSDGCDATSAPFVQWLEGGPGCPATFSSMSMIGNWYIDEAGAPAERCFSWCRTRNCLFVDSPTMTGFSFQVNSTGDFDRGRVEYTKTSQDATEQLYGVLKQVITVWPELRSAPYHITGESYGGNYVPWMAKTILEHNSKGDAKINLAGISVGDPVMNWKVQMPTYATTLYSMGLVMEYERDELAAIFQNASELLDHNCSAFFEQWNRIWNDDGGSSCEPNCDFYFKTMTGSDNTENALLGYNPENMDYFVNFLKNHAKEFHIQGSPDSQMSEGGAVYETMVKSGDFCQDSAKLYTELFIQGGLDVTIWSSNMDPLLGPPTTEAGIKSAWSHARHHIADGIEASEAFDRTRKTIWAVAKNDKDPAGYGRCSEFNGKRFCYTIVRNAGHTTASYQPRAAYDMSVRIFERRPFDSSWFDGTTPECAQCGGSPPLSGKVLPECAIQPGDSHVV